MRYLTKTDTTYLEYYHNGTGYTQDEIRDFFHSSTRAHETYLSSGAKSLMKAKALAEGNFCAG
jgi:hypothetical protein